MRSCSKRAKLPRRLSRHDSHVRTCLMNFVQIKALLKVCLQKSGCVFPVQTKRQNNKNKNTNKTSFQQVQKLPSSGKGSPSLTSRAFAWNPSWENNGDHLCNLLVPSTQPAIGLVARGPFEHQDGVPKNINESLSGHPSMFEQRPFFLQANDAFQLLQARGCAEIKNFRRSPPCHRKCPSGGSS